MRTYRSGLSRFLSFCQQEHLPAFPLSESTLCRFVAYLFNQSISSSSIRLYLSALRFFQIERGGQDPSMSAMPRLCYVLRGTARQQATCVRPARLPITIDILHQLFAVWSNSPSVHEATMLWAACTLGFFGFLRAGEFTVVPNGNQALLSPADIQVDSHHNPTYLVVQLRGSKTDPFGRGHTLYIGSTRSRICPVTAVLAYLAIRPRPQGPLFLHADGSPLTRSQLIAEVWAALQGSGLDLSWYTGHSFRIGAATSAAQARLSDPLIQIPGRWRSSVFQCYLRTPASTLVSVSQAILQAQQS